MRSYVAVALVMGVAVLAACEKTGEGEYEVQRPTVGVETDTVQTPSVDVGTQEDTVVVTTDVLRRIAYGKRPGSVDPGRSSFHARGRG